MAYQDLLTQIEGSFKLQFPNGYIKTHQGTGFSGYTTLTVDLGLIGNLDDVSNKIRHNDPMHHKFMMFVNGDNHLEVETLISGLSLKPEAGSFLAMNTIKTGFRKIKGDKAKVNRAFDRFFVKLKSMVEENHENIFNAEKYKDYI